MDRVGRYVSDSVFNACSCFVTNLFHYLSPCFAIVCIVVEEGNGMQSKRVLSSVFRKNKLVRNAYNCICYNFYIRSY